MENHVQPLGGVPVVPVPHEDGRFISDKVSRIIEVIRDYDPNIVVQWVPPDNRDFGDPAFRLLETQPDGKQFIMFYVQDENAFDEGVLARIFNSDQIKNPFSLEAIDAHNKAVKAVMMKEKYEAMEEAHDLAAHIWRSPKARYRHNGVVFE